MDAEPTIEQLFSEGDAPTGEAPAPEPEAPTPEAPEPEVEAEAPAAAPEGSSPEPEKQEPESDAVSVPLAALMAERGKRKEAEQRIAELEKSVTPAKEPDPLPDVFADQEGFAQRIKSDMSKQVHGLRVELSQDIMRSIHSDYDEREAKFLAYAQDNPAVLQSAEFQKNPARFAYDFAGKIAQAEEIQDLDAYRAKIKEEVRAEFLKEQQAQAQATEAESARRREAEMPTLASSGSAGSGAATEQSLEDLLPRY